MHFIISKEDYDYLRYDAVDRLAASDFKSIAVIFTHDEIFSKIIMVMISCVINAGFSSGSYVNVSDSIDAQVKQFSPENEQQANSLRWVLNEMYVSLKNLLCTNYVEGNLYSVAPITDRFSNTVVGFDVRLVIPFETAQTYSDIIPISSLVAAVIPGDA